MVQSHSPADLTAGPEPVPGILTSFRRWLLLTGTSACGKIYAALPSPGIANPIFIIGCGRSGTTILGTALSRHRDVTYLDEPRHLWVSAYPNTDIWSAAAPARGGKLWMTADDADPVRSRKLARLLRFETLRHRRPVLIEKLPINTFRLSFLHKIFPAARYVHIYRNGLEVARSIQRLVDRGNWFGANSYKWDRLVEYARGKSETEGLPPLCTDAFHKGLLEWRLSTESVVGFLRNMPSNAFVEVNYEHFVDEPAATVARMLAFIGLDDDPEVNAFVAGTVARRSSKVGQAEITSRMQAIGGELLPLSMNGGDGLTRHAA